MESSPRQRWLRTDNLLAATGAALILWLVGDVLILLFAGLLLAVALDTATSAIATHTPLTRRLALPLVAMAVLLALLLLGLTIIPPFLAQLDPLWDRIEGVAAQAQAAIIRYDWAQDLLDGEQEPLPLADIARAVAERLGSAALALLGLAGSLIVIIVIALFGAADPELYRKGTLALVPPERRGRADEVMSAIARALRRWMLGQVVSMLFLGVTVSLGLMALGLDLWLSLGVLTALLTFIPFLGPIIAAVPILIVAFADGSGTGLMVLVFYLLVQNLEGNILMPLIQQRTVHIAPAVLIASQLLLGALFGIAGFIFAAPLAVAGMIAVKMLYVEDVLGEKPA